MGASIGVFAHNSEVYAGWITIASSYTWLPLLLGGGIILLRNPRSITGIVLFGVSAGLLALASASQSVAHAFYCSLVFFGSCAVWLFRKGGMRPVLQLAISLVLAGIIAFGIGAVSAVPVSLGIKDMIRHIGNGFVLGNQKIPWEKFGEMQMGINDLPAILLDPGKLEIVGSPYVGPLGVLGVVLAFCFFRRLDSVGKLLVGIFGAIGLYGLLSAFGTNLGLAYLNYHLPFLSKIREGGRYLVLFVVGVVILSGIGCDQLGNFLSKRANARCGGRSAFLGLGFLLLFFVAAATWEFLKHAPLVAGGSVVLLLAPTVLVVGLLLRTPASYIFAVAAVFVSIAAAISPVRTFPIQQGDYSQADNLRNLETLSELKEKLPPGDFRIDFVDQKTTPFTWAMNASYFGYASFYNRLTPQPYDQFRFSLQRKPPSLREVMGGRYVLCRAEQKPPDPAAMPRFEINGYTLFENPAYMERLTLVYAMAGKTSDEKQFIAQANRGFDFRKSVFLQDDDAKRLAPFLAGKISGTAANGDRLQLEKNSVNRIRTHLELTRPGVVILNEWYSSAWHARVNGRPETTVRANQWQVGVPVRAGRNIVEFTYRPTVCWILLIVNRATWGILALLAVALIGWKIRAARLSASQA